MYHIVEQTHEERVAMYMRLKKKELAEMLANQQEAFAQKYGSDGTAPFPYDLRTWAWANT